MTERQFKGDLEDAIAHVLHWRLGQDEAFYLTCILYMLVDDAFCELIDTVTINRNRLVHEFVRE